MGDIYYKGAVISEVHKEKRGFFFTEELFEGDFSDKAPKTIRKKVDLETLENIEACMKGFLSIPSQSKMAFKSYTQFKRFLEDIGISLKQYIG